MLWLTMFVKAFCLNHNLRLWCLMSPILAMPSLSIATKAEWTVDQGFSEFLAFLFFKKKTYQLSELRKVTGRLAKFARRSPFRFFFFFY